MTIHNLVEGDGPTIVLLHAGVADLRMWDQPSESLVAAGHRVVRCDLRGYGSTPVAAGASYSDAEDVLALIDELGVTSFRLVGASYGGYVAQQVATALPSQVERLVLVCTAGDLIDPDPALRAFWQEEERLLESGDLDGATELNVAHGSAPTPATTHGSWSGPCSGPPSTTSSPQVTSMTASCRRPRRSSVCPPR